MNRSRRQSRNNNNNNRNNNQYKALTVSRLCRTDQSEWVRECRESLLEMESRNINTRALRWTQKVNEKIRDANRRLNLQQNIFIFHNVSDFNYTVSKEQMKNHLKFIHNWKGLKSRQVQNVPKTYNDFEQKAKNWLNGRRAPNYASTLFPDMIKNAEIYASKVSGKIFGNNAMHSKTYCKIVVIGFLSVLCSARISLNDASKKAYLICENSVKTGKTPVSQILQRYATDHPYPDKFPSHLREAADFFEKKYMELISDFSFILTNEENRKKDVTTAKDLMKTILNHSGNHMQCNMTVASTPTVNSHLDLEATHSSSTSSSSPPDDLNQSLSSNSTFQTHNELPSSVKPLLSHMTSDESNGSSVSMTKEQFYQLGTFLTSMISNQKTQQMTIMKLLNRVESLEKQQRKLVTDFVEQKKICKKTISSANAIIANNQQTQSNSPQLQQNNRPPTFTTPIPPTIMSVGGHCATNSLVQQQNNNNNVNNTRRLNNNHIPAMYANAGGMHGLQHCNTTQQMNNVNNTRQFNNSLYSNNNNNNINNQIINNNQSMGGIPLIPITKNKVESDNINNIQQRYGELPSTRIHGHGSGNTIVHAVVTNHNVNINGMNGVGGGINNANGLTTTHHGQIMGHGPQLQGEYVHNQVSSYMNGNMAGMAGMQTPVPHLQMDNTNLPSTSMIPRMNTYSNDTNGDTNMFYGQGNNNNNNSFCSSDAGMAGFTSIPNQILGASNTQVPLDYGAPRFSDSSLNLPYPAALTNISNLGNLQPQ